jgi:hypothetical protein
MNKQKYRLAALLTFVIGIGLLAYGIVTLGLLSKNKIVVTTLATTGPDYDVVFGQLKLKSQLPDTLLTFDVNGIMTTGNGAINLNSYLQEHYSIFGDYFVLKEKIVGVKKSDTDYFHPLIEVLSWRHINKVIFWLLTILDLVIFILVRFLYLKYVRQKISAKIGVK